jgi:GYF domain 2
VSYFILRHGQQFGPYSPADLQHYLGQGNITLSDLGRTEEMNEWLPLSQIQGTVARPFPPEASSPAPPYWALTAPSANAPLNTAPSGVQPPMPWTSAAPPPGLHWGILLVVMILTLGLFGLIWSLVVAKWVRKIDSRSPAVLLLIVCVVFEIAAVALLFMVRAELAQLAILPQLVATFLFVLAMFRMRKSMLEYYNSAERIRLKLSGVMTFFFNVVYFQYKCNRIPDAKRVERLVLARSAFSADGR